MHAGKLNDLNISDAIEYDTHKNLFKINGYTSLSFFYFESLLFGKYS